LFVFIKILKANTFLFYTGNIRNVSNNKKDVIQMALIQCNFFSETHIATDNIPYRSGIQSGAKEASDLISSAWLVDDHTIWIRFTSIEGYVAPQRICPMPFVVAVTSKQKMGFAGVRDDACHS
jgi:hypothetical protein